MKLAMAVSWAAVVVFAGIGTAQTVPTMTIEIHNDTDTYSIYPVLSTGGHFPIDTWMQAVFKVQGSQLADNPYPTPNTFRRRPTEGTGGELHGEAQPDADHSGIGRGGPHLSRLSAIAGNF